jgi:hypothetical protein
MSKKSKNIRKSVATPRIRKPRPVPPHGAKIKIFEARTYAEKVNAIVDAVGAGTLAQKTADIMLKGLAQSLEPEREARKEAKSQRDVMIRMAEAQNEADKNYRLTTGNQLARRERDTGYGRTRDLRAAQESVRQAIEMPALPLPRTVNQIGFQSEAK